MADTPITASTGASGRHGIVRKVFAAQQNDVTHVALNPDQGRILIQRPDGSQYTTVASTTVSSSAGVITLIHEAQ